MNPWLYRIQGWIHSALEQLRNNKIVSDNGKRRLKFTGNVPRQNDSSEVTSRQERIKLTGKVPQKERIKFSGVPKKLLKDKKIEEICTICGEPILPGEMYAKCDNCGGYAHKECWEYIGRCGNLFSGCYLD